MDPNKEMTREEAKRLFVEKVAKFLETPRKSRGGYAPVPTEDYDLLRDIIALLIGLKWETDPDGDYPIEIHMVNRHVGYMRHLPSPYPSRDLPRALSAAMTNLDIATDQMRTIFQMVRHEGLAPDARLQEA